MEFIEISGPKNSRGIIIADGIRSVSELLRQFCAVFDLTYTFNVVSAEQARSWFTGALDELGAEVPPPTVEQLERGDRVECKCCHKYVELVDEARGFCDLCSVLEMPLWRALGFASAEELARDRQRRLGVVRSIS